MANPPSFKPRTSVAVSRSSDSNNLVLGFNGEGCGHGEILTLAEAEALAERILDWVEYIRFEQCFGARKS